MSFEVSLRSDSAVPLREVVKQFLRRFSYKPDWTFTLRETFNPEELIVDIASSPMQNADHPDPKNLTRVYSACVLSWMALARSSEMEARLTHALVNSIQALELHEVNEWAKLDGKHITDPHPELKPMPQRRRDGMYGRF